jgi:hypothetical protein
MDITLYRYNILEPRWDADQLTQADFNKCVIDMKQLPFEGETTNRKYGIVQTGHKQDAIYGLFVQKYPTQLIDYDIETKEEDIQEAVDSGEYLFVFFPKSYELYLQTKRSSNLPSQDEIVNKFTALIKMATRQNKFFFGGLSLAQERIDRSKIINIFYEEADAILELELEDFDPLIITEQRQQRGGARQTYFNPREEYQEAMEEAGIKLADHAARVSIRAKQDKSLKKDPIARAALEGSKKPIKIVYQKERDTFTTSGIMKTKEIISIESDIYDLDTQIADIIDRLQSSTKRIRNERRRQQDNDAQSRLV